MLYLIITNNSALERITERCKREFDSAHRKRLRRRHALMQIARKDIPVSRKQAVRMIRIRGNLAPMAMRKLGQQHVRREKWRRIKQAQRLHAKAAK